MLVLSRKEGQKIQIGDNITLVVLGGGGKTVRLGIEAPPDVPVHRAEVAARLVSVQAPSEPPRLLPKPALVA